LPLADKSFTVVIDQGTSATKVFLFNSVHRVVFNSRLRHSLKNSKPGHVEADALTIARSCEKLRGLMVLRSQNKNIYIASAGIAVQRSTFLFWDRNTIKPLNFSQERAIVSASASTCPGFEFFRECLNRELKTTR
jgi:glycerol kinase